MADLIDRQAAIEALYNVDEYNGRSIEAIRKLPFAQPTHNNDFNVLDALDLISRNAVIAEFSCCELTPDGGIDVNYAIDFLKQLPSAQPEPLTDKEQRIFLAAMSREEKVCKQVDAEYREPREPYEDSLVSICHEITRKVKGALWT